MARTALVNRETGETTISVELNLDGAGQGEIKTGSRFLDHLLAQLAHHGLFDIKLSANGSDQHHVVEDVGISLGRALGEALGERRGIVRMAHAVIPMDDALVMVAVDIGGRGYAQVEASFSGKTIGDLAADLIPHFLESLALEARLNLHVRVLRGTNDHHKAEALFKALARALDGATRIDDRLLGRVPSTKDLIEG
ncbi:MAG: imidazoleglycerol-phosphate dehydratase HisB [Dehalococcoidia bacterium]